MECEKWRESEAGKYAAASAGSGIRQDRGLNYIFTLFSIGTKFIHKIKKKIFSFPQKNWIQGYKQFNGTISGMNLHFVYLFAANT